MQGAAKPPSDPAALASLARPRAGRAAGRPPPMRASRRLGLDELLAAAVADRGRRDGHECARPLELHGGTSSVGCREFLVVATIARNASGANCCHSPFPRDGAVPRRGGAPDRPERSTQAALAKRSSSRIGRSSASREPPASRADVLAIAGSSAELFADMRAARGAGPSVTLQRDYRHTGQ